MGLSEDLVKIIDLIEQGIDREAICEKEGIQVASLNQRFRRYGYRWNDIVKNYTECGQVQYVYNGVALPPQVVQVIRNFGRVKADAKRIASKLGYMSEYEMARTMSEYGFRWNSAANNYVPNRADFKFDFEKCVGVQESGTQDTPDDGIYDEVVELESQCFQRIPRYRINSPRSPKTINFAISLTQLLQQYSNDFNLRQSDVVETAIVEFFRKYGYRRQIDTLLSD